MDSRWNRDHVNGYQQGSLTTSTGNHIMVTNLVNTIIIIVRCDIVCHFIHLKSEFTHKWTFALCEKDTPKHSYFYFLKRTKSRQNEKHSTVISYILTIGLKSVVLTSENVINWPKNKKTSRHRHSYGNNWAGKGEEKRKRKKKDQCAHYFL